MANNDELTLKEQIEVLRKNSHVDENFEKFADKLDSFLQNDDENKYTELSKISDELKKFKEKFSNEIDDDYEDYEEKTDLLNAVEGIIEYINNLFGNLNEEDKNNTNEGRKDPNGIEIAKSLLAASKIILNTIDPAKDPENFKNELANIFVCSKYLEMQEKNLYDECPDIYQISLEIKRIASLPFMDRFKLDTGLLGEIKKLNQGDPYADEDILDDIYHRVGIERIKMLKMLKKLKEQGRL